MEKKKILKVIGIILVILLIILLIYCIRNIVIFNNLAKVQNFNNYAYTFKQQDVEIEIYCKDGITKEILKYTDGTSDIIWYNSNTKESLFISGQDKTVRVEISDSNPISLVCNTIIESAISNNVWGRIYSALTTFINTEEVDGVACYVLKPWCGVTSNTYYFNKESKTLEQAIIGIDAPKTKFYNWKTNKVTDEDINRPDLSNYNVIETR